MQTEKDCIVPGQGTGWPYVEVWSEPSLIQAAQGVSFLGQGWAVSLYVTNRAMVSTENWVNKIISGILVFAFIWKTPDFMEELLPQLGPWEANYSFGG